MHDRGCIYQLARHKELDAARAGPWARPGTEWWLPIEHMCDMMMLTIAAAQRHSGCAKAAYLIWMRP